MQYKCPACRRSFRTRPEFVDHTKNLEGGTLWKDVLEQLERVDEELS